ncbi:hypothetical protein F4808DRAFT_258390 [Astrocystis sublimbata]|nr:hypothetical protein F4808DRAFT_258390 [Astrocystis sublimbata]
MLIQQVRFLIRWSVMGWSVTGGVCLDIMAFAASKNSKEDMTNRAVESLGQSLTGSAISVQALESTLRPIRDVLDTTWSTFKDTLTKPFRDDLAGFLDCMRPILEVVKKCRDVCDKLRGWFQPHFWILDAIYWVLEHTLRSLIESGTHTIGVDEVILRFISQVKAILSIDTIENIIEGLVSSSMSDVKRDLVTLGKSRGIGPLVKLNAQ